MSASHFSRSYGEARRRFREAAHAFGAAVDSQPHPLRGMEGEELAIDTALAGPADAPSLFVVSSGTHGPEGFAGSACQLAPSEADEARLVEAMAAVAGRTTPGVSSGQATHADGLFYAGTAPAWSNRTIRSILRRHGRSRHHIVWIDIHTGLGPYGHGEKIFGRHPCETLQRALSWWGRDLIASVRPESVSPRTTGHITGSPPQECPEAAITPMTLEYGTLPSPQVRRALRGEAWLAGHPDAAPHVSAVIRQDVRDAFYVDADDWKGMVLGQFRALALQTINGLAAMQEQEDAA